MSTSQLSSKIVGNQNPGGAKGLRLQRAFAFLLLLAQGGITVTGSIVRVTGSGLGCDTWPQCHEGSLFPVPGAQPAVHQAVEFGNRLLTFVVAAAAVATLVALIRYRRRSELVTYAAISVGGILVQAIIGGVSVLMDLHWWTVAMHFLPSMILVWVAALLFVRIGEPDDQPRQKTMPSSVRTLVLIAAIALSFVLVTGTLVTGSGPHAGDAALSPESRLQVDTRLLAYVHAACMYVYLFFTVLAAYFLHATHAPRIAQRTAWFLLLAILVQWVIGTTQFHLGVPRWTVPLHIAMTSVVVALSATLWSRGYRRLP